MAKRHSHDTEPEQHDLAAAQKWLADAKEIHRVKSTGEHASPLRIEELMYEAIPVIENLVSQAPPADE